MKTCFMVMGFGVKMDYRNSRKIDLDVTYKTVIKPLFDNEFKDLDLLRADEICHAGSIDKDMYEMLLKADLVIADITTENANAIYELGVRHALRPASTIILMRKGKQSLPFDLNHLRIILYGDLEGKHNEKNITELQDKIRDFINGCKDRGENFIDSPVYEFLHNLCPPSLDKQRTNETKSDDKRITIAKMVADANNYMQEEKFMEAAKCWQSLHKILPQYAYIIQQWALARYKSEYPNKMEALEAGWKIIELLCPDKSLDTETLGIAGAISKRMHLATKSDSWIDKALYFYRRGYMIENDYYNGENVANCLLRKMKMLSRNKNEYKALDYERKNICKNIIASLSDKQDDKLDAWECASMAVCNYHLRKHKDYKKYKEKFLSKASSWKRKTFYATINELEILLANS